MSETKDQKAKSIYEALYMQKRQDNDKDVITELVNIMKDSMISEEQIEYFIQSDLIVEARDKTSTVQTYLACRYFNLLLTIVNNVTDTDLYKRAIIHNSSPDDFLKMFRRAIVPFIRETECLMRITNE